MLHYQVTKSYTSNDQEQWDLLIASTLGVSVNSERKKGYIFAREALRSCFFREGLQLSISELQVKNYQSLEAYPQYTLSLSHSRNAGAAVLALRSQYMALGIDIETIGREVKEPILKRIAHKLDEQLPPLEHWCIKEAAFKCLMNTGRFSTPFEFAEIQISRNRWHHAPSGFEGEWSLQQVDDQLMSLAWIKL